MKEIPILMSTIMVQATIARRKNKTRRIIKPRTAEEIALMINMEAGVRVEESKAELIRCSCPFGKKGDMLYVRESHFRYGSWTKEGSTRTGKQGWAFKPVSQFLMGVRFEDNKPAIVELPASRSIGWYRRSSLFLPKAESRIWLQVEDIRIERLQEITESEVIAEGIETRKCVSGVGDRAFKLYGDSEANFTTNAIHAFQSLWFSIHGVGSWTSNPWVWVVTFKVLSTIGKPSGAMISHAWLDEALCLISNSSADHLTIAATESNI